MSETKMSPRQALGEAQAAAQRALDLVKEIPPDSVFMQWGDICDARAALKDVITHLRRAKENVP